MLAQQAPALPELARFALPESGLEWKAAVHPLKFFDATGHRAGVFGRQTGQYEAWIYPIKVLHGLRLEFRQEGMAEPVRGEDYLEYLVARPESTTLVYVHPRFTVRQTIWTPLDEPAIVNFFDVDSDQPLEITAKFVPDFKPMWPASLGGQYSYWIAEEKAFGFTDGTSKPTAVVGSPNVGAFTEHMDHAMAGGEMLLRLRVTPEQARKTLPILVMALSMESSAKARETYRSVLSRARELYEVRVKYHREFLARTLQIETPDAELNRALAWAKVAIDAGWVCHATHGCGLVAGYGPAGEYERPGFAWWFGGDALMASWAMLDYGDTAGALQVLRFLKARQRADGKIMHEITQSVDLVDWFGKYGFAYYHADTTPMYIYSAGEYWRRTGDKKFLEEFWPSVKKAYEYCLSTVDPADGLMDNTKAGLAAVEVGPLRGKVTKDIYLEGFWLAALEAMFDLGPQAGAPQQAKDAQKRREQAEESLRRNWWSNEDLYFPFGIGPGGKRADMIGVWPAVLLSLVRFADSLGFDASTEMFSWPEIATDWGTRWLSNKDALYDPLSYNNGSVWPFMTGFASLSQFEAARPLHGYITWRANARLTGVLSPGSVPEMLNGDRLRAGERAVPHQLFSSVGVLLPAVRGLLGLGPDRDRSSSAKPGLRFAPQIPFDWALARFRNYQMEGLRFDGEIRQDPGRTTLTLTSDSEKSIPLSLSVALPPAAQVVRVLLNGKVVDFDSHKSCALTTAWLSIDFHRRLDLTVEYKGGLAILAPAPHPGLGDRTTSLRFKGIGCEGTQEAIEAMQVEIAGMGQRAYTVDLQTTLPNLVAEGATVKKTERGYRLEISFEGPETDYVTRKIRLRW